MNELDCLQEIALKVNSIMGWQSIKYKLFVSNITTVKPMNGPQDKVPDNKIRTRVNLVKADVDFFEYGKICGLSIAC
jgi:hypothetical protein